MTARPVNAITLFLFIFNISHLLGGAQPSEFNSYHELSHPQRDNMEMYSTFLNAKANSTVELV